MNETNPKESALPITTARMYKDQVFRMIFKEKENFLTLYNAVNGTNYVKTEELVVTTLDNAIYMGMKNDVSFLLYDHLTLYEHQATQNPNMPLRNLLYAADIYSSLTRDKNLYSTKLIPLPEPQFVVFYNGTAPLPEYSRLKLSSAYLHPSHQPSLELITQVYNINLGYNREIASKCKSLKDYMVFVDKLRRYTKKWSLERALDCTIKECIASDVLAEFLSKNRAEVIKVSLYEYDAEKHRQMEREEWLEEGQLEGAWMNTATLVKKKWEKGFSTERVAEVLELELSLVQEIFRLLEQYPDVELEQLYQYR